MRQTENLGLALYDSSDKMNITGESDSLNHNMEILDNEIEKRAINHNMKIALDNLFKCVAYDGDSDYVSAYENFKTAFGLDTDLQYISAVFNGESAIIGTDARNLNITVTGHYTGQRTAVLTGWTINGIVELGTNVFTIVLGDFSTTVSVTGIDIEDTIPSEYTKCSYIKSNGSQYLKTNNRMIAGTDKFIIDFKINEGAAKNKNMFGGYTGAGAGRIGMGWSGTYLTYSGANSWVSSAAGFELQENNRVVAILDTKNGIAQLGENISEFTPSSFNSVTLLIFGYSSNRIGVDNMTSITLYRFQHYRNDELLSDLVPCIRNSDSTAGLYDLISGKFFTNLGSGTFEYEVE